MGLNGSWARGRQAEEDWEAGGQFGLCPSQGWGGVTSLGLGCTGRTQVPAPLSTYLLSPWMSWGWVPTHPPSPLCTQVGELWGILLAGGWEERLRTHTPPSSLSLSPCHMHYSGGRKEALSLISPALFHSQRRRQARAVGVGSGRSFLIPHSPLSPLHVLGGRASDYFLERMGNFLLSLHAHYLTFPP